MTDITQQPIRLSDYQPTPYSIETVNLDIRLHDLQTIVKSVLTFSRRTNIPGGTELCLSGGELHLLSAELDGTKLPEKEYTATPDSFILHNPPDADYQLTLSTRLDPTANTKLEGLYKTGGAWCTQCEAEGFRRITYFYDRPDVLSIYTTRLEAKITDAPCLLSNGNLIEKGNIESTDRHFVIWHDPHPKPCYLFALIGGDLGKISDQFTTRSGRKVTLEIFVEHGKEEQAKYAMGALQRSMKWDEDVFGREYDLDIFMIVAVPHFNMGAMENKGLNIFNDKYVLAKPDTATDQDYINIEAIIAHEYFHNWTGNRITCRDWFQLCLKEGLTVFRDQEFTSDMRSRANKRIADALTLQSHQFTEDAGPLAHAVRPAEYYEINNFYTATVYEKGAELCRMIQTILGRSGFRKGLDLWFDRHDGDASTVELFLKAFEDACDTSLVQFYRWYEQAGTPQVHVETNYNSIQQEFTITLMQVTAPTPGQTDKLPLQIPIRFGLIGSDGQDIETHPCETSAVQNDILNLTEARQSFVFKNVAEKPILSLLREFSAPVKLIQEIDHSDLLFQIQHDSDPYNRWQAMQCITLSLLKSKKTGSSDGKTVALINGLKNCVLDRTLDPAFRAQMLTLPAVANIARELATNVDPVQIFQTKKILQKSISDTIGDIFMEQYHALETTEPYSPTAEQTGPRALRNALLSYLSSGSDSRSTKLVEKHYNNANNMTDQLSALRALVHDAHPCAELYLDKFRTQFHSNPLVMDKWMSLQATSPSINALEMVQSLTAIDGFSWENPNRVRALVGAFAAGNIIQFTRKDGAGFRFISDAIKKLDAINPQLAAGLLTSFRSWKIFEPGRRAHAKEALENIWAQKNLSTDVKDILTRTLN